MTDPRPPASPPPADDDAPTEVARPAYDLHHALVEATSDFARTGTDEPLTETTQFSREDISAVVQGEAPLHVVVLEGGRIGDTVALGDRLVVMGRDPEAAIPLTAKGVSRQHAVIEPYPQGGYALRDLASANGTFLNKKRVETERLQDGDLVFMGAATIKVMAESNPEYGYWRYLHETSVRDPLTDAPNRRYFDDFLSREIERARRYGRPLCLLLVDVDLFKTVNDTHGHRAGDQVLRDLVKVVHGRLRRSEFMARYGGEEFAIIATETPITGAQRLAEGIRALVERHPFTFEERRIPVTVSIGVAEWTSAFREAGELVGLADERLYRAKRDGRNRVCAGPAQGT
ncbi:MAG: GGDEF domain-containing protein [Deltaproteobacteria bacterium]|nr:GGDEF domain-containing protein [Deltaproteobacteria bacterium]